MLKGRSNRTDIRLREDYLSPSPPLPELRYMFRAVSLLCSSNKPCPTSYFSDYNVLLRLGRG